MRNLTWPLAAASLLLSWQGIAVAAPTFQPLLVLLTDQSGWTGEKPQGESMDMPGKPAGTHGLVQAERKYAKGEATADVTIMTGEMTQGILGIPFAMPNMETTEESIENTTVNGVQVHIQTEPDKQVTVLVKLADGKGALSIKTTGIDKDDAVAFTKGFDWKGADAAVAALQQ